MMRMDFSVPPTFHKYAPSSLGALVVSEVALANTKTGSQARLQDEEARDVPQAIGSSVGDLTGLPFPLSTLVAFPIAFAVRLASEWISKHYIGAVAIFLSMFAPYLFLSGVVEIFELIDWQKLRGVFASP